MTGDPNSVIVIARGVAAGLASIAPVESGSSATAALSSLIGARNACGVVVIIIAVSSGRTPDVVRPYIGVTVDVALPVVVSGHNVSIVSPSHRVNVVVVVHAGEEASSSAGLAALAGVGFPYVPGLASLARVRGARGVIVSKI